MKRRESVVVTRRNEAIARRIGELKSEHPFWGYRRIWAYLKYVDKLEINKKRVYRLMHKHHLLVKPNLRIKACRTPGRRKPRPECPNQWWGIDMTKVMVNGFGWVYVVAVLDWYTKKVVGYYAGLRCTARNWLEALEIAVNRQFPQGVRDNGLSLMSDNGCQPTSMAFLKACSTLGIRQAFTSYNNPKGNADTERFFRTLKEELVWLQEWSSPFDLINELDDWMENYNQHYLHSALGYRTPAQAEVEYTDPDLHILKA